MRSKFCCKKRAKYTVFSCTLLRSMWQPVALDEDAEQLGHEERLLSAGVRS